jgi:hypothetical protein
LKVRPERVQEDLARRLEDNTSPLTLYAQMGAIAGHDTRARLSELKGIPTVTRFFGVETAKGLAAQGKRADLLLGNNVLAHVPDLKDFVAGMKVILKPEGVITMEFPHLQHLIGEPVRHHYHEHFSYSPSSCAAGFCAPWIADLRR